ncbi:Nif3-like dinuclear metal center hexameric protein [bacterium SCSIO 12741]|nr:Nif3-like dinuclear metal center hexameric protein [bacterium SCSIO 12741]
MKIQEIIRSLEKWAPPALQESYDNAGVICGDTQQELTEILVSLDCTEAIVDEAIQKGCNLIVSHHPIVFRGLKSLTGKNYVERTVIKAIQNNIVLYATHTNLDHVSTGVNFQIGQKLGIENPKILAPKKDLLQKLVTFCPKQQAEEVRQALFDAGAGHIGQYDHCSFNQAGSGTFRASESANPYVGEIGKEHLEEEVRIEVVLPAYSKNQIISALLKAHPYEEVAWDLYNLANEHPTTGAGMVGDLSEPMEVEAFLTLLKERFKVPVVRHTPLVKSKVQRIAWCGGAGSFLIGQAKRAGADLYLTGDVKYHEFFDAEDDLIIADIGHFESEQFTIQLIASHLKQNFSKFASHLTEVNTNPVKYF